MEHVHRACGEQARLVATMVRRKELFVPMLGIWVASFGGALHAPVTTYFHMEVGASTSQIGNFGAIKTVGVLLMSPFYGWLLDARSAYLPAVLSAFCCTFGCLLQGFAGSVQALYVASLLLALGAVNFWNVVQAYVALAMPREQRPVVVTGFQVQVSVLRLLGTSLYPSWDALLLHFGVRARALRYHIHMSLCSLFCVLAFFNILTRFEPLELGAPSSHELSKGTGDRPVQRTQLALLLGTLVVHSFGETVVTVLWPLHIRKLGWDSHEYAYLQLLSQLMVILATVQYPTVSRLLGQRMTATALLFAASVTCACAFLQYESSPYGQAMHTVNALAFLSVCGATKVCFLHLATLAVPPALQGRAFSLLNMLSSLGAIIGNLFGTRLADHETPLGVATPFLMASCLFGAMGVAVFAALTIPDAGAGSVELSTNASSHKLLGSPEDSQGGLRGGASLSPSRTKADAT